MILCAGDDAQHFFAILVAFEETSFSCGCLDMIRRFDGVLDPFLEDTPSLDLICCVLGESEIHMVSAYHGHHHRRFVVGPCSSLVSMASTFACNQLTMSQARRSSSL